MPVAPLLPPEAIPVAHRRAAVARQLDLLIEERGPVTQVRRLLEDLDRISLDLARALDASRQGGPSAR